MGAAVAALGPAVPAHAESITVSTALDVIDGTDTVTSLREAVAAANLADEPTTIVLAAGTTYELNLCAADEDLNASGDLDYTGDQPLTIEGNGATVEQTCADQRVLHITGTVGGATVIKAKLTGGASAGAAVRFAGSLVLDGVTVTGNTAGAGDGVLFNDGAASGGNLKLIDSTVGPNTGTGARLSFGGTAEVTNSTVKENTGSGVTLTDGTLTVVGSRFEGNGEAGVRTSGQGEGLLKITDTVVRDNDGIGIGCQACGNVEVIGSAISLNKAGGIAVSVDQDTADDDLHVTVTESNVFDNDKDGPGAGLDIAITELSADAPVAQIIVTGSTFAGNEATGAEGRGGAIAAVTGEVRLDNSTVSGNKAAVTGGGVAAQGGEIFLRHATIVENSAPAGPNITGAKGLTSFGSIVAGTAGDASGCAVSGTTTSSGYNLGGGDSCAFTGTGDRKAIGDPKLGPLQDNGGPTRTRLPLAGSPAIALIPASACTALTDDQRGNTRPQAAACEAGAVEVAEPASGGGGSDDDDGLPITGTPVGRIALAGLALVLVGGLVLLLTRRRRRDPTER
jgi:hypothetical protein